MPTDPQLDAGDPRESVQSGTPPKLPGTPEFVQAEAVQAGAPPPLPAADRVEQRRGFDSSSPIDRPAPPLERSTAFFDSELIQPHTHPIWGALFVVAAVGVLGAFLAAGLPQPAGVLTPPLFVMALALLRGWAMPVRYKFGPEGIEINRPRRFINYDEIQHVLVIERGRKVVVEVLFADGHLRLPASPDRGAKLLEFLQSQPRGRRAVAQVPARFTDFLRQQQLLAPAEEIFVFRGGKRHVSPRTRRYRRAAWWFVLLAATWFALAAIDRTPLLPAFGALAGVFALIFLAGGYTPLRHSHLGMKNVNEAILIVTPTAMALQQGDLCGELRWSELVSVAPLGVGSSRSLELSGLTLKVRGAAILLVDIYQWPLTCAAELIKTYSGR